MKRAICLLTVAPVLAAVGCGGGDDSTPTTIPTPTTETPKQLSKEQFIAQGDGFCAEVNAALGGLSGSDAAQAASLYKGLLEHLRGLGTPDDEAGLNEFLSAGDDLVSAEEAADQATQDNNDAALASAESDAATAQSAFASAASSYGFEECGQGPSTSAAGATPIVPPTATAPVPAPTTTVPVAPVTPAPTPGATGAGGGTTGTGGGSTGGGSSGGSGGVGPG